MSQDFDFEVEGKKIEAVLLRNNVAQEISHEIIGMVMLSQQGLWPDYKEKVRPIAVKMLNGAIVDGVEIADVSKELEDFLKPPFGVYAALMECIKANFPDLSARLSGKLEGLLGSI